MQQQSAPLGPATPLLDLLDDFLPPGESAAQFFALLKKTRGSKSQFNTPYKNTLQSALTAPEAERQNARTLENITAWNSICTVLQGERKTPGLGGHLATFASASTLYEVLQNHFLHDGEGLAAEILLPQGHASPGLYARAWLEGRLSDEQIALFRQETIGGLPSYPHPRRMPDFWQVPTVSMGLGPLTAIALARMRKYIVCRDLHEKTEAVGRVWAFLGDGELLGEPESLSGIWLAGKERLSNLVFVVSCNLQRLDGPVQPSGKVIQEAERIFRAAGWLVLKIIWASEWDSIFERDKNGKLLAHLEALHDGDFQQIAAYTDGGKVRAKLTGGDPEIAEILAPLSDAELLNLRRGGHDAEKVYAAYAHAVQSDRPVVILAKTLKGNNLGSKIAAQNNAHQNKEMRGDDLVAFCRRLEIPLSDEDAKALKFYRPPEDSPAMQWLHARRKALGGYLPARNAKADARLLIPPDPFFNLYDAGKKTMSTTKAFVEMLREMLNLSKQFVFIVPDEGQTFGADSIFKEQQVWNPVADEGVAALPVFSGLKESRSGGVFQEGINEAGALATFTAAGTSYALNGVPLCPFYMFYSMFGFQRVGDSIWAAADALCRGFLLGGTAGRTTLNGEGLQHQDGHSHLLALTNPAVISYDPATSWEVASLVRTGLHRMFGDAGGDPDVMFYLTLYNEIRPMPARPIEATDEAIARGIYRLQKSGLEPQKSQIKVNLLSSGTILFEALEAAKLLENEGIATDVWSVTSWTELYRDADNCRQHNLLNPSEPPRKPHFSEVLEAETGGVFVAVSDWMRLLPGCLEPWIPGRFIALGTDGFGLSDSRANLRQHFGISPEQIVFAAQQLLARG